MLYYTVYYKHTPSLFWKKINKVKGDGLVEDQIVIANDGTTIKSFKDIRWFILEDETRIEMPTSEFIFKFSKERYFSIKERMDQESGTDIKINKR